MVSDVTWFNFALNDQIAPLGGLFSEAGVDTGDFVDALLGDYVLEGENYGVPFARSTPLFYYNTEHYEEAGLDEAPETWDEVTEHSEALMDAEVASSAAASSSASHCPGDRPQERAKETTVRRVGRRSSAP